MELKPFWIHCASPPPPDVPGVPVSSYEELAYSTPAHWIGLATERGWWYMVNQHLPAVLSDDARLFFESWIALFDAESRLRREFQPEVLRTHHPGLFPMVPGLFGLHQSPHTLPLRQYLQILAGREVSVCAFDKPFGMSLLDSVAHDIVQVLQSFASTMGHEVDISANPYPDYLARCEDWLVHLRRIFELERVQVRSDQGPGAYYATSAYGNRLSRLPEFEGSGFAIMTADEIRRVDSAELEKLLLSWKELPWIPPEDWPKKISKGRGRGRRRRSS
ncbi:MAG TPA: hypothetical protein ENH10_10285 [Bacteroidetes bacterium]|nr:hypothetical protein [Bacteroidota bacterium]HEX05519.1 hypothetical protein [Bacteroidota bacterium]